ncbi:MAG: bacteriocin immunity protein [Streptococcus gallolyticus]|uniref:Bacteriocin immunity protein n=1 Tax=Streptococcus gallolyticus TaxID=315405 RepID=A0A927XG42_9STRE|nr:bacteriocin immunity protein [Streptococcus gallolyticus]
MMLSLNNRDNMLEQIYDLILDSDISDAEREIFLEAKKQLENNSDYLYVVSNLKTSLSPLALQFKLSKKTLHFYGELQKQFPVKDKLWRPGGIFF